MPPAREPNETTLEYRKLQITGGSTFVVSLPKRWIEDHNLKQSDVVGVEYLPTGEVQVTPHDVRKLKHRTTIHLEEHQGTSLYDYLIGVYVSGCDVIVLKSKKPIKQGTRRLVRRFLRETRGMEMVDDDQHRMEIMSLLNPNELPLQVSLNRMYLLVTSLVEDTISVLEGLDPEALEDADERERQIDARRMLIDRQVAMALNSHIVERSLGVNRYQAMEHGSMARSLERMGDHALSLAMIVINNDHSLPMKLDEAPLSVIPQWLAALRTIIRNTYSKEMDLIAEAKASLHAAIEDVVRFEDEIWAMEKVRKDSLIQFRVSEIVRRLCGYSIDLSETLINMLMSSETERVED